MSSEFTIEELINAIAAARVDTEPARGVRVQELKQATGHAEASLTRRLRVLIETRRPRDDRRRIQVNQ